MAETTATNGTHVLNAEDGDATHKINQESGSFCVSVPFVQKVFAEVLGNDFVIFAGCRSVVVNLVSDKMVSFPGISIVWGLVVMVMIYSVGHISGADFNHAVTIAFAVTKRFPLKQVPAYVGAQILGSILAAGTLRLIFNGPQNHFARTIPSGSPFQSFVIEFIITFYLMFVVSGVATCWYHTRPTPKLLSIGQLHTVKDPEEFPSAQEANHNSTHVKIGSQSERDTWRHQEPIRA